MRFKAIIGGITYYAMVPAEASGSWAVPDRGPPLDSTQTSHFGGTVVPTRDGGMLGQAQESLHNFHDFIFPVMTNGGTMEDLGGSEWGGSGWLALEDLYNRVMDAGADIYYAWTELGEQRGHFAPQPLSVAYIGDQAVGPVSFRIVDKNT